MNRVEERQKPSITAVLEHYGADCSRVREYGRTQIRCPFHEDRSPSGWGNMDTQRYTRFTGGPGGDAYDLLENYEEGVEGYSDAVEWLRQHDLGSGSVTVCEVSTG